MTKEDLKIVFFGTPEFAVESLDRLVSDGYNVAAVVTATDKPAGRGHHLLQSAVKQYAVAHGLPVLQPVSLKDPGFIETLRALDADLFIVIAFRMLPEAVWTMPRLGTFNLHGSLLPRYRGAAPINRAVMNGDKVTGVTTFFLKHEIDTGDIIDQRTIEIGPDENAGSVYDRLMHIGAELTVKTVESIIDGTLTTRSQASVADVEPCSAPKIFSEDCRIDWRRPASAVHNHVRGLAPYPSARSVHHWNDGSRAEFKIHETKTCDMHTDRPAGSVILKDSRLFVACGDGVAIEITELQPSGKRRMTAAEYLRGAKELSHFCNID